MIVARKQPFAEGSDMEAALVHALRQQAVRSLADLMDYVAADGETVRRHLSAVIGRGEAAELRPVTGRGGAEQVFYRWRRPGEENFRTQQLFFEGARPHAGLRWYDGQRIKENADDQIRS